MHTEVETLNSYSRKLKVELSPEDLEPIEKKVLKNYQRSADIRGFRRGHAPLTIIKQRYRDMIQQDIIEQAFQNFYGKAMDEAKVDPVSQGKITDFKFENVNSGMSFEIEVEVEPEFELKKYKGLKVEKDVVEVTDSMIDEALQQLREQYATAKDVDEAQEGHYLHFDAQELDSGDVPIIGHKYENLQTELGSGNFDKDIEVQLLGIRKDEKRIVRKEMPPAADAEEKEPKISSLEIHAKRIEEKEFPELNDDFVKNLDDEKLENMEQLRDRIRENMKLDFSNRIEQALNNRVIDALLHENAFEVPPTMVDNYLDEMVKDVKNQQKNRDIDEEAIRKEYRASAIHNLRWYFLKKKLVEAENLTVTDQDAEKFIDESGLDEKTREMARKDKHYLGHLKEDLLEKKVLDMLKENAEIVEVFPMEEKIPTGKETEIEDTEIVSEASEEKTGTKTKTKKSKNKVEEEKEKE
ncbi:MAG: trigger factor [Calditrichia bacterium]